MNPPSKTNSNYSKNRNMASSPFPSSDELYAASALLLLHAEPAYGLPFTSNLQAFDFCREVDFGGGSTHRGNIKSKSGDRESLSLSMNLSSDSRSCASSLTSDGSSLEIQKRKLRAIASKARFSGFDLKVARNIRSKVYWSSNDKEITISKPSSTNYSDSVSTGNSCLSSSPTATSKARRGGSLMARAIAEKRKLQMVKFHGDAKKRNSTGSSESSIGSLLRSRAEAILKLLSGGCSSEVKIRRVLGDNPDTSKALRMLLKLEEIKRSGTGGRLDPYLYTIAAA